MRSLDLESLPQTVAQSAAQPILDRELRDHPSLPANPYRHTDSEMRARGEKDS